MSQTAMISDGGKLTNVNNVSFDEATILQLNNKNIVKNGNSNFLFIEPMEDNNMTLNKLIINNNSFDDIEHKDLDRIQYTTTYDDNNLGKFLL